MQWPLACGKKQAGASSCPRHRFPRGQPVTTTWLLLVRLQHLLDHLLVGPRDLVHLFSLLDEQERRHAGNLVLGRYLLILVDVYFEEHNLIFVDFRLLLEEGLDHLAGPAPRGVEVHHHQLVAGLVQLLAEVLLFAVASVGGSQYQKQDPVASCESTSRVAPARSIFPDYSDYFWRELR